MEVSHIFSFNPVALGTAKLNGALVVLSAIG